MARAKKPYQLYPDCDVRGVGLSQLAELAGMPRTNTYRAITAGVYAVRKVDGFKKPYSTHTDSAYSAPEAWTAHIATERKSNLRQFRTHLSIPDTTWNPTSGSER